MSADIDGQHCQRSHLWERHGWSLRPPTTCGLRGLLSQVAYNNICTAFNASLCGFRCVDRLLYGRLQTLPTIHPYFLGMEWFYFGASFFQVDLPEKAKRAPPAPVWNQFSFSCVQLVHGALFRIQVTTCLENLEMSGNLTAVREMSGILLKIRELSGKKSCQGKLP